MATRAINTGVRVAAGANNPGNPAFTKYLNRAGATTTQGFVMIPEEQLRVLLHSGVGNGKSSFLRSIPGCWIWDIEKKHSGLAPCAPGTLATHFPTFEGYLSMLADVVSDRQRGTCPFNKIAIDPVNALLPLVRQSLTQSALKHGLFDSDKVPAIQSGIIDFGDGYKSKGAGFGVINSTVEALLREKIVNSGFGLWLTLHEYPRVIEDGGNTITLMEFGVSAGSYRAILAGSMQHYALRLVKGTYVTEEPTGTMVKTARGMVPKTNKVYRKAFTLQKSSLGNTDVVGTASSVCADREMIPLPDEPIELPEGGQYDAFMEVYRAAASERQAQFQSK